MTNNNGEPQKAGSPYIFTRDLEGVILVSLLTPWGNPSNPECTWGIPILIWGAPGIGKSGRISYISLCLGLPPEVTYPATNQPENVSGALIPDGQGSGTIFPLLAGVKRLIQNKQGVWIIDELSCARPAVQAAFLGAVYERRVGEEKLPGGIRIIAAANPPEEAAGGWELEPPMANRFCHIYMKPPSV
jgi:MoxR-like ATPase